MVAVAGSGWRLAPCLVLLMDLMDRAWPDRDHSSDGSIGDTAHAARTSDHNPDDGWVHAVDIDEDLSSTQHSLQFFADWLLRVRDPRVRYVIYEGRILKAYASDGKPAWSWHPYDGINAHAHHLHLSICRTAAARNDLRPWTVEPVAPKPPIIHIPTQEDEMIVIRGNDTSRPARFVCGAFAPLISAKDREELEAKGVKSVVWDDSSYDRLLEHVRKVQA